MDTEQAMLDQMEELITEGNGGQTLVKAPETFPPKGIYRLSNGQVQPLTANSKAINVTFDLDECVNNSNLDVKGKRFNTALWINSPKSIERSRNQLSWAVNGAPASGQATARDVALMAFELANGEWIVDRDITQGDTQVFIRDRFYTEARWNNRPDKDARVTGYKDLGPSDEPSADEIAEALDG